jgi:hypothetical protein
MTICVEQHVEWRMKNYLSRLDYGGPNDEIAIKYKKDLGHDLSELSDEVIVDLQGLLAMGLANHVLDPETWTSPDLSSVPTHDEIPEYLQLAYTRGETADLISRPETNKTFGVTADGTMFGVVRHRTGIEFEIYWDYRLPLAAFKEGFSSRKGMQIIDKIIPRGHRINGVTGVRINRASIAPWTPSLPDGTTLSVPIPVEEQQKRIDNWLRQWPLDLRSLLLCGKYNTSKTTFVCAWLTDVITDRVARTVDWSEDSTPLIFKITLNQWFDEYLAYRTRDFDGSEVNPPEVTAKVIKEQSQLNWYPPILWIEELDKVTFTDTNRKWLFTLVDAVYEEGGCIVATTNDSYKTLADKLGEVGFVVYI